MREASLACVVVLLLAEASLAAHPQLLLEPSELTFMRAKVASHSADWQDLKSECDDLTTDAVQWPDAIKGPSSLTRGYVTGSRQSHGFISTGYNGGGFDKAITELGVCYQALRTTDPVAAARYLVQAHNIISAIAQPPLTLTRQNDGAIRYAASVDFHGRDLPARVALAVFMPYNSVGPLGDSAQSVNPGEIWTISGATGCTSMNGTWRVSAKDRSVISFTNLDGSTAPPLNANCSLWTTVPMQEAGYALRFWMPALAKAYDWFYDGLSQKEKDDLLLCMKAWMHELALTGLHSQHPESNYSFGNFWAIVAVYLATDGDDPAQSRVYLKQIADRFTGPNQIVDYRRRWLSGGGFGEGWQAYGFTATRFMMNAMLAMKIHGIDWTQPPYNFNFVDDTLRYWMQFTTPSKLALDDNEYVYPIGATEKGVIEPTWIPLGHAVMFTAVARRFESAVAPQFQSWYRDVYSKIRGAADKEVPDWRNGVYKSEPSPVDEFLYYDPKAPSADWKTLPLMYRAWSGNYAVSRTDWTNDAVEVTLLGGPTTGAAGNGKTQFNSGSLTVQRGSHRLLVYGLGEASRSGDILNARQVNQLHGERATYGNKKNSIFWAGANAEETRNQGLTSRTPPPGQLANVKSWGSSIDRAEDTSAYTYWRASGIEANNARSSVDGNYHQTSWTREVLFLRPKLVIVHDRTCVLNEQDDRAMFWTFGRELKRTETSGEMTRYEVSFKGNYRGAFTSVLPSPATVSVVDHDNLHFLYRVEVRPAAMDHKADDWLVVLDAADSPRKVTGVAPVNATNADAVQFDDGRHTAVAFSRTNPPTLPITINLTGPGQAYVAGLSPNTNYKVMVSNTRVTLASDDGTHQLMSSAAGVLLVPAQ